ncbi:MAG: hypothetical protein NT067_02000 [Candidatus Diapherotrites archaeon]|nr:hypothetical protein [Candidatus Diapherotrites archaeon]
MKKAILVCLLAAFLVMATLSVNAKSNTACNTNKKPTITITYPERSNTRMYTSGDSLWITVQGVVKDNCVQPKVLVNGGTASVSRTGQGQFSFSKTILLKMNANAIHVKAIGYCWTTAKGQTKCQTSEKWYKVTVYKR